jgi:hypothetical protein
MLVRLNIAVSYDHDCEQRVTSDMNSTGVRRLAPDERNSARGSECQTHFLIMHVL